MSRSIRGRHPNRRKNFSSRTYRTIDQETYRLARSPKPPEASSLERYYWERAHEAVFRGGPWGHHSDYHQADMRWRIRKRWRASQKQKTHRLIRDYFSLDEVEIVSILGSKSMESSVAEFLVIEVDGDGDDGLSHLCEAETWEAAVEEAKTEGRLDGPAFRQGPLEITDWMVRACRNEIAEKLDGLTPSDADMRAIIASDTELRRSLLTGYSNLHEGAAERLDRAGLDTYDREALFEAFATFLGSNEGWPRMMADEKEHEFFLDLVKTAAQSGKLKNLSETI